MNLFTTDEVCDFLRISKRTLMRLRHDGKGPVALRVGGQLRYPDEEIDAFIQERYKEAVNDQEVRQHANA